MGKLYDIKLVWEYFPLLLTRLHITLLIVLAATLTGLLLGILLAQFRLYRIPVLSQLATIYISLMRGTPI
ncbi:MAG TPA: amino acid ABC transporter permease, partial [Bacillota bacterium]|nr:amino acid ABC transporter permease [Bacillota bacterium]